MQAYISPIVALVFLVSAIIAGIPEAAIGADNGQVSTASWPQTITADEGTLVLTMDKPVTNADGSTDIYFGPSSPGEGKNWLKTLPDRGFFVILRLYGPTKAFFDQTWKPSDIEKLS